MRHPFSRLLVLPCLLLSVVPAIAAEALPAIRYQLSLTNLSHHEAEIAVEFRELAPGPLQLQMASASPGRYARHDFAKNIYDIRAASAAGEALVITRTGPSQWEVPEHAGEVVVSYKLFGDHADGTYTQLDRRHAHMNMPASFLWSPQLTTNPLELRIDAPAGWRVATQLGAAADGSWHAPNLAYFLDSPIEVSAHQVHSFTRQSGGREYRIELALHHDGTQQDVDVLLPKLRDLVAEQQQIFGELPDFENGRYTFIADFLPDVDGDGMEHRNSTIVTTSNSLLKAESAQVETMAHEFFHAWNVERLRPATLEPFDFTQPNMSDLLWFAEGFTNYYGKLTLIRSGHFDLDTYLAQVVRPLDATLQAPSRRYAGPAAASRQAVFVDAGVAVDPTNWPNTYLSYYTYGEMLALALDLTLRTEFDTTLDALMRAMWQRYGKSEQPYTAADLQAMLAEVSGDAEFASGFFRDSVNGSLLPDFAPLFARMGLTLAVKQADKAYAGALTFREAAGQVWIDSAVRAGTGWYMAGAEKGDQLLQLGRYTLTSTADLQQALGTFTPGERVPLVYVQRGERVETELQLGADPQLSLGIDPDASAEARALRAAWLE